MTPAAGDVAAEGSRTRFLVADAPQLPALSARRRAPSEMSPNVNYAPLASKEEENPSKAGLATENPPAEETGTIRPPPAPEPARVHRGASAHTPAGRVTRTPRVASLRRRANGDPRLPSFSVAPRTAPANPTVVTPYPEREPNAR